MGTVPLLTREGEVEIAKRIERGQNKVLKAMSRCSIVIREIQKLGEELKSGARSIKGVVVFNDDELTDERIQERLEEVIWTVEESNKLYKKPGPRRWNCAAPCRSSGAGSRRPKRPSGS